MIYDSVENVDIYCEADDAIGMAVDFVRGFDVSQSDGRYDIDGDNIFAMVQTIETGQASEKKFEAHEKYIDVQVVIEGRERHDVVLLDVEEMEVEQEYDSEKDLVFFKSPATFSTIIMKPGMFVVYGPGDGHRPGCAVEGSERIRKVCVKVRMEEEIKEGSFNRNEIYD